MTEIKDCLPQHVRKHFISLRNVRLEAERAKYEARLREFRAQLAAQNMLDRWGGQAAKEWEYKQEFHDNLAIGYVEDAFETCRLYDEPITQSVSDCLLKTVEDLLEIQYRNAIQAQGLGLPGHVKMPLAALQQGSMASKKIMPRIRVMVETARVEDMRRRAEMTKQQEEQKRRSGDSFTQNINQHGGVLNAQQAGNVSAQHLTSAEPGQVLPALAEKASDNMTFWGFLSMRLGVIAVLAILIVALLVFGFYPPTTKEFALYKDEAAELQASFSGAKLEFLDYEPFDTIIDGQTVPQLNHCKLQLASDGTIYPLPATYTQAADGSTKQYPNESLSFQVDGRFEYTLVGGVFEWNGDHLKRCHFTATLTRGPRLMAAFSALSRWVRSILGSR
jgi:hypothetical protein